MVVSAINHRLFWPINQNPFQNIGFDNGEIVDGTNVFNKNMFDI